MQQLHAITIKDGKADISLNFNGATTVNRMKGLLADIKIAAQCGQEETGQLAAKCCEAVDALAKNLSDNQGG